MDEHKQNAGPPPELKQVLTAGLDTLLEKEAKMLKTAVEVGELASDPDRAKLLIAAGLIEQLRDDSSTRVTDIVYCATRAGMEVYSSIYSKS